MELHVGVCNLFITDEERTCYHGQMLVMVSATRYVHLTEVLTHSFLLAAHEVPPSKLQNSVEGRKEGDSGNLAQGNEIQ
jgi:hypothetical protein